MSSGQASASIQKEQVMDLRSMLAAREAELSKLTTERAAAVEAQEAIMKLAEKEQRNTLTVDEQTRFDGLSAAKREKAAAIDNIQKSVDELRKEIEADDKLTRSANESTAGAERPKGGAVVTNEERTYTRRTAHAGRSFFADAYRAQYKYDREAQERLQRHDTEVRVERDANGLKQTRAANTTSFAGLVVPQYLTQYAALVLRAGRPLANACTRHQLPDEGMTLYVPRGTTGSSTAIQATENATVSTTDEVWSNLTVPVVTIAGYAPVSRQSLERGEGVDEIIYLDLARAYGANLDNQVINGSGTSGQMLGILNTSGIGAATAFGAAPTITNFNLKVAGQITAVTSAGAGIYPTLLAMHPRRWGWLMAQVDGSNRPVVLANQVSPYNAASLITQPGNSSNDTADAGLTGWLTVGIHSSGLPILTDLNIPTNVGTELEDVVLACDTNELHLWEDGDGMPTQLSFEQTAGTSLTTTLVVYGYAAFTAGRYPAAVGKVGGVDTGGSTFGLVAPSF